jgi:hypothetical protein
MPATLSKTRLHEYPSVAQKDICLLGVLETTQYSNQGSVVNPGACDRPVLRQVHQR